jgi:hypothetical protein
VRRGGRGNDGGRDAGRKGKTSTSFLSLEEVLVEKDSYGDLIFRSLLWAWLTTGTRVHRAWRDALSTRLLRPLLQLCL